MKNLILALLAVTALSANAQDATSTTTTTTTHPKARVRGTTISTQFHAKPRPVVNVEESSVQGILPHATRLGQPLQMLNPLAPHEYGDGSEYISRYSDDPHQGPKNQKNDGAGFKLFAFEF